MKKVFTPKQNLGEIKQFSANGNIIWELSAGFFGKRTYTLVPRQDGCYDICISIKKEGQFVLQKISQTFPVTDKDQNVVPGLTQTTLALGTKYDKDKKIDVNDNTHSLYITTHQLREPKFISPKVQGIGYVTGSFGFTVADEVDTPQAA